MRAGQFAAAWALSEEALQDRDPATRDDPALPYHLRWVWDGRDFAERHALVRCYHGLGDTIQFARFLPQLAARTASLTVEVQPRLIELLAGMAAMAHFDLVPFDPVHPLPPSECDLEISELPFALRASPSEPTPPYLQGPHANLPPGTIGLCYGAQGWDFERCISPQLFAPLCRHARCITLMPEPTSLDLLNPQGCPLDMMTTAALVAGTELVITVDTMVAHLAGAMGKPTWLLLKAEPDWRWPPGQTSTHWYPTMRLYAQPSPGDWPAVMAQVECDLATQQLGCLPSPSVPVSWGELIDKVTILEIKHERLAHPDARANVAREHRMLSAIGAEALKVEAVEALFRALRRINEELWEIEDAIRSQECAAEFGECFVRLARSVYQKNDERAALKRRINSLLHSDLVEEKSYTVRQTSL